MIDQVTSPINIRVCTKFQRGNRRKDKTLTESTLKIVQNAKHDSLTNFSGKYNELLNNVHNIRNIWMSNSEVN